MVCESRIQFDRRVVIANREIVITFRSISIATIGNATANTRLVSFPGSMSAVQPLICGSGVLRSAPLHNWIFFNSLEKAPLFGSTLFFGFFNFGFCGAGIGFRTSISDYANSLNFDLDPRSGEICDSDQRASGIVPILEVILSHLNEFISVTRFLYKNGHRDHVVQAAACPFQNAVNLSKYLFDLSFEIVCDVIPLTILGRGLASHPHNYSTGRNDTRRKRPR